MHNSATVTIGDITLDVIYYYEPAIKGGAFEAPQAEFLSAVSATWNGVEVGDLISALGVWVKVEDALRDKRRDAE